MSFRGRLFIFFTIIVIVPMAAVAVVLFKVTSDSETGKSDSRIAQGLTTALAVYQADVGRAHNALTQVARDPQMSRALARRQARAIRQRARAILKARPDIAAIAFYNRRGGASATPPAATRSRSRPPRPPRRRGIASGRWPCRVRRRRTTSVRSSA